MNPKQITTTIMMISNWKKHGLYKKNQSFNPFTAGAAYIRVFVFLFAQSTTF